MVKPCQEDEIFLHSYEIFFRGSCSFPYIHFYIHIYTSSGVRVLQYISQERKGPKCNEPVFDKNPKQVNDIERAMSQEMQ